MREKRLSGGVAVVVLNIRLASTGVERVGVDKMGAVVTDKE